MSSCTNEGPFDGGTYNEPIINKPTITGGTITSTELDSVYLTNNIKMDDAVAQKIASSICEHVKACVEFPADAVAAVFNDCNGKAHVPQAQLPTCEEMSEAITRAMIPHVVTSAPLSTTNSDIPTTIVGDSREQILGKPYTYIEMGDFLIPAYKKI